LSVVVVIVVALPPTPTTVPVSHGSGLQCRTRSCSLVHVRFPSFPDERVRTTLHHLTARSALVLTLPLPGYGFRSHCQVRECT
jgi:hypothetical protein